MEKGSVGKFLVIGHDQYLDGGVLFKVVEAGSLEEVIELVEKHPKSFHSSTSWTYLTAIPFSQLEHGWDWVSLLDIENPLQDQNRNYAKKTESVEERKAAWCKEDHGKIDPEAEPVPGLD